MKAEQKFKKVMHEFAQGKLESNGKPVTDQKQALAIAFSEARKVDSDYGSIEMGHSGWEVKRSSSGNKNGWHFTNHKNFSSALYKTRYEAEAALNRYLESDKFDIYGSAEMGEGGISGDVSKYFINEDGAWKQTTKKKFKEWYDNFGYEVMDRFGKDYKKGVIAFEKVENVYNPQGEMIAEKITIYEVLKWRHKAAEKDGSRSGQAM